MQLKFTILNVQSKLNVQSNDSNEMALFLQKSATNW